MKNEKLMTKYGGFSNLICKKAECRKVTTCSTWRCRCRRLWIKCPVHVHEAFKRVKRQIIKRQLTEREKLRRLKGVDVPVPRRRGDPRTAEQLRNAACESAAGGMNRVFLKPGSILARRFEHLVQASAPT